MSVAGETEWPVYERRESALRREVVILFLGIGLLLLATGIAWYFLYARRSPVVVVEKFIEADLAGDNVRQRQYVSTRLDSRFILSMLQTFRKQAGTSPFTNHQILGSTETGSTATVDVMVTLVTPNAPPAAPPNTAAPGSPPVVVLAPPPAGTYQIPFALVREEGEWKIDPSATMAGIIGVLAAAGFQQITPNLQNLPNAFPPGTFPGLPTTPAPPPATQQAPPPGSAPNSI